MPTFPKFSINRDWRRYLWGWVSGRSTDDGPGLTALHRCSEYEHLFCAGIADELFTEIEHHLSLNKLIHGCERLSW